MVSCKDYGLQCVFFMGKSKFSKSTRIFIRREKARIRREIFDPTLQKEKIAKLYQTYTTAKSNDNTRNLQPSNTKGG